MGIEPTWDRLHSPTPDLKSGSPTSELGTSVLVGCTVINAGAFDKALLNMQANGSLGRDVGLRIRWVGLRSVIRMATHPNAVAPEQAL
jgi:hypothetical protein